MRDQNQSKGEEILVKDPLIKNQNRKYHDKTKLKSRSLNESLLISELIVKEIVKEVGLFA